MREVVHIKPRWQITIPKSVREALEIAEGDYLAAEMKGKTLILKPMKPLRIAGVPRPAKTLSDIAGVLSIGGNALEDTRKLYE